MNLKDWILNYLNQEKNNLNSRISQRNSIMRDTQIDEDGRQDRLKTMNDSIMQDVISYRAKKDIDFIKARTVLMPDRISGHMPDYYPGSTASNKYGKSRSILNQIESEITSYMDMGMIGNAKLTKLDGIIALANTLDHKYCDAYDKS